MLANLRPCRSTKRVSLMRPRPIIGSGRRQAEPADPGTDVAVRRCGPLLLVLDQLARCEGDRELGLPAPSLAHALDRRPPPLLQLRQLLARGHREDKIHRRRVATGAASPLPLLPGVLHLRAEREQVMLVVEPFY